MTLYLSGALPAAARHLLDAQRIGLLNTPANSYLAGFPVTPQVAAGQLLGKAWMTLPILAYVWVSKKS